VKWGVLGVAKIAVEKVIPAMQRGEVTQIAGIASRDLGKARAAADKLGIARAFGSYEDLLADGEIEAVYNPLPNDLHIPWTLRALEAGKHVLCEKPIALDADQAHRLRWRSPSICCCRTAPGTSSTPRLVAHGTRRSDRDRR
jgi:predicted dehydrogenase